MTKKLDSLCQWQEYIERRLESLFRIPVKSITGYALHRHSSISGKGKRLISGV
jgi:hypothetical protein